MNFEDIEDAIIARIQEQLTYLKTVETYAGQLEADIEGIPVRYPAAFVTYGGSDMTGVDTSPLYAEKPRFGVLCCASNVRGITEAVKGDDAGTKGAYDIVNDVLKALVNRKLGLDMEKLRPVKCDRVYVGESVAVYAIEVETDFDTDYS